MRVSELWRYPVKGLRGEPLGRIDIAADGIPGDRSLRVADERPTVTGRQQQVGAGEVRDRDQERRSVEDDDLERLAGMAHLNGIPVRVEPVAAAVEPASEAREAATSAA